MSIKIVEAIYISCKRINNTVIIYLWNFQVDARIRVGYEG